MKKLREQFGRFFANDIGIDLGTANTLVYVKGKGVVLNEPTVVAVNSKTGQVVAVGKQARDMLGRTPSHIQAVRPLSEGVISDFEITEEMLSYLIGKAQGGSRKLMGPRVVIGVPSGITNVETRAVRDAARNAGAREVYIVEEPMAAAIGIKLPLWAPMGSMIIDIGGGTTDVAVLSLGGIVRSKNVHIAGDTLNNDIMAYIRSEFKILVGEKTAEELKKTVCTVGTTTSSLEKAVRGRDLITGLPREVIITDSDVREATQHSVASLIDSIKEVLETTPPEVLSDVMQRGIHLCGGGALIRGLPETLAEELKIPIYVASDPLTAVVRGTGIILEDIDRYQEVFLKDEDAVSALS